MFKPTIHLNGTSRQDLLDDLTTAVTAMYRAIECVQDTAPNARDYYPQGGTAWRGADTEHRGRVERLRAVLAELGELAEHVADAEGPR